MCCVIDSGASCSVRPNDGFSFGTGIEIVCVR